MFGNVFPQVTFIYPSLIAENGRRLEIVCPELIFSHFFSTDRSGPSYVTDVIENVDCFFKSRNSDQKQVVRDYILANKTVERFCVDRANCIRVCLFILSHLKENSETPSLPPTTAELFLGIVKQCCDEKEESCPLGSSEYALDKLCKLCLELLRENTKEFSEIDGIQKEEVNKFERKGLIHRVPRCTSFFVDQTLQALLAACSLIKSGELIRVGEKSTDVLANLPIMVIVFVAGLLGQSVRESKENVFDLKVTWEDANEIMSFITKEVSGELLLKLIYNYQQKQFAQKVLQEGRLSKIVLNEIDDTTYQAVAFLLTTEVEPEYQVKDLTISLSGHKDFAYVVEALKSGKPSHLKNLSVNSNVGDEEIELLIYALISDGCPLEVLAFHRNTLSNGVIEHLGSVLVDPKCRLRELTLGSNQITDKGASQLTTVIQNSKNWSQSGDPKSYWTVFRKSGM